MASFGLSLSDIVNLISLINTTYHRWKNACGEYSDVTDILSNSEKVFRHLRSLIERRNILRTSEALELKQFIYKSESTITGLNNIIERHQSLSSSKKRNWDRISFGGKGREIQTLRDQLSTHVTFINAFLSTESVAALSELKISSQMQDQSLEEILKCVREIHARESKKSSGMASVRSQWTVYDGDSKEVWRHFRRELVAKGIDSRSLKRNENRIKEFLQRLEEEGEDTDELSMEFSTTSNSRGQHEDLTTEEGINPLGKTDESLDATANEHTNFSPAAFLASHYKRSSSSTYSHTGATDYNSDQHQDSDTNKWKDPRKVFKFDSKLEEVYGAPIFVSNSAAIASVRKKLFNAIEHYFDNPNVGAAKNSSMAKFAYQFYSHGLRHGVLDREVHAFLHELWWYTMKGNVIPKSKVHDVLCEEHGEWGTICSLDLDLPIERREHKLVKEKDVEALTGAISSRMFLAWRIVSLAR